MALYGIDNWMVVWNSAPMTAQAGHPGGQVRVGPYPDETGRFAAYASSAGCCYPHWHELKTMEQKMDELIRGFFYLVLGEGLDPQAVHRGFSKIEGYLDYEGNVGLGKGPSVWFQRGKYAPYNP